LFSRSAQLEQVSRVAEEAEPEQVRAGSYYKEASEEVTSFTLLLVTVTFPSTTAKLVRQL
jgi:hypothetical protein